ncbi:uncharacterized protein CDV56_108647 [Aspergillus thermomutatus]|uniref:Uncharacterized protein n=1 Tax=Aspergillus thermomutatus TaxID=41047 RepID=A0A397HD41_ASPTH|nr:uncharacterized protein CDV56_108647 [Aspergillus thermomutatus]RHZ60719.1 hypothetical protein CDV56_108647 [Aspergillus thermomutatus]
MTESASLHDLKAHATTAVAAGGAVYAANQLVKSFEEDDKSMTQHLKAGVGAAVAIGALEMLNKEDGSLLTYRKLLHKTYETSCPNWSHSRERHENSFPEQEESKRHLMRRERVSHSSSWSSSVLSNESGHNCHLVEELVGAYSLGKQLLGDKKHKIVYLVADAMGAAALLKEINEHDLKRG